MNGKKIFYPVSRYHNFQALSCCVQSDSDSDADFPDDGGVSRISSSSGNWRIKVQHFEWENVNFK